jgi:hypothetical protein
MYDSRPSLCARPIVFALKRNDGETLTLISTHSYLLYSSYTNDDDGDETLHGSLLSARLRYSTCHGTARTLRVIHYPSIVKKEGWGNNNEPLRA